MPPIEFTGRTPFRSGVRRSFGGGATPLSQPVAVGNGGRLSAAGGAQSVSANLARSRYEPYPAPQSVASGRSRLWLGELDEGALKSTGPLPPAVLELLQQKAQVSTKTDRSRLATVNYTASEVSLRVLDTQRLKYIRAAGHRFWSGRPG